MKLHQRTILITGGSSGIGLELADQLLQRDNTVIVTGRDQAKLDALKKTFPGMHVLQSDVSDPQEIVRLYRAVVQRFPGLDTLINNAGIMRNLNLNEENDLTGMTHEIEVNLNGPVRMVQQFLPHLKKRGDGLIVNVSSALAFVPLPAAPVYSATKAALRAYTRSLRVQLRESGVRVVELAPPAVQTALFKEGFEKEMQGQKMMTAAMLAQQTIAGIESGKLEIRPGMSNFLMLMSRIAPEFALAQMVKALTSKT